MSTRRYFGTDGIRGQANVHPMTAEVALRVGLAAGKLFTSGGPCVNVQAWRWMRSPALCLLAIGD